MRSLLKTALILPFILVQFLPFGLAVGVASADGPLSRTQLPVVHVDPSDITDPTLIPSSNITITLKISNVTGLYGFAIQLGWNASILNYTSHTAKIPVEVYPEGILHNPVVSVTDSVNVTAGIYSIIYTSLGGAPSFNGSGTIFEMNFTVLGFGECPIDIITCDLSDRDAQRISRTLRSGYFTNLFYDVVILDVATTSNTAYVGDVVNVTVVVLNNGTLRNETFNVVAYFDGTEIETTPVVALPPNTEKTLEFNWNTSGVSPGAYVISANATIVQDETITENNSFENGVVELVIEPIHDIAVLSLTPLKTVVFKGYCFSVNVTLENQGNFAETFNLTLYANSLLINRTQIYLNTAQIIDLTFAWETTDAMEYEDYILNATVDPLHNESDSSDNTLSYSNVELVHPGDFDADMDVDIFDIVLVALAYDSEIGDPAYDSNLDVDCNGQIDIFDIVAVTVFYGYEK